MRHELHSERLTVLPKRLETDCIALANIASCINAAAVLQGNGSIQAQGLGILSPQTAVQTNLAAVVQNN